ncbi:MAG: DNA polymerase Y family protein [Planctomycetota bacterium]|nr:MAG: DNA polymerase Y family protein [Planctomycetota bacterium]
MRTPRPPRSSTCCARARSASSCSISPPLRGSRKRRSRASRASRTSSRRCSCACARSPSTRRRSVRSSRCARTRSAAAWRSIGTRASCRSCATSAATRRGATWRSAVARLACVELPNLALQLLLLREPAWRARPAAVIERDAAEAAVLALDERAWRAGVRPGQRYAAALALCRELAAGVVEPAELARGAAAVLDVLRGHSPRITASVAGALGGGAAWWLDLDGFERLQPSLARWTAELQRDLFGALGLRAAVVVGFRRLATLVLARELAGARALVLGSPADEERALRAARLERAGLEPAALAELERLGVRTFDALLALPEEGLARRYGAAVARVARCAAGREEPPFAPVPREPPAPRRVEIEELANDAAHVLALCEEPLAALLAELHERGLALAELALRLELDGTSSSAAPPLVETLRPAEPTLERAQLSRLLALRLAGRALPAPVAALELGCRAVAASAAQLELYGAATARRDLGAASRAFAALRALYGDACVVRARLVAAHLPESCYAWEPLARLEAPRAQRAQTPPLVRCLLEATEGLLAPSAREPDGWLARGLRHGPVVRVVGPYLLAGGWWGAEAQRDYYYAELRSGEILWLFHDRRRGRWRLHGGVG